MKPLAQQLTERKAERKNEMKTLKAQMTRLRALSRAHLKTLVQLRKDNDNLRYKLLQERAECQYLRERA